MDFFLLQGDGITSNFQPGMGLLNELWDHIIGFIRLEGLTLAACCMTCKIFARFAYPRLRTLLPLNINVYNYNDINLLIEEVSLTPERANCVESLNLMFYNTGYFANVPLFAVPYRLPSKQLTRLKSFSLPIALDY